MRKQGHRESTTYFSVKSLKWIARRTNLLEPEQAKTIIATATMSESRKRKLVEDLARFYGYKKIQFDKPHYKKQDKLPFIPLESEIDSLISASGKKTAIHATTSKRNRNASRRSMEPTLENTERCAQNQTGSSPKQ